MIEVIALIIAIASFIFSLAHALFVTYWLKNIGKLSSKYVVDPEECNHKWKVQMSPHRVMSFGTSKCIHCGIRKDA